MRKLTILYFVLLISYVSSAQTNRYILHDINVIDVVKGKVLPHQVVSIEGDRIKDIISLNKYRKDDRDSIISLTGKFLIPGLWDMHTHVWSSDYFFPLFLANGVTGFRDMFGGVQQLQSWRKSILEGNKSFPDLFYSGPIVDGPNPVWPGSVAISNAEQGRKAVDSIKNKLKTDFVKVYSLLSRESFFAIAEECKKLQIDFAGHVPNQVTALEAAKAGMKCQEHLYGILEVASDSSALFFKVSNAVFSGATKSSLGVDSPYFARTERRKMLLRTYSEKKMKSLANELSTTKTWLCPTLLVNRNIAYMNDSTLANDSRMKYVSSFMKNFWDPKQDRFRNASREFYEVSRQEFERKLLMIPILQKAGVRLLAGTDTPNPYCIPGFGLHDELFLFAKAGLSPAEALKTATINPAIYFSRENDFGTIDKGKIASMVVLDKNPLEDIRNTTSIHMVILRGSMMDRRQLESMLEKIRSTAQ